MCLEIMCVSTLHVELLLRSHSQGGFYAPTVLAGSQRSEGPTAVHLEIPVALDDPQQGHALADIHICESVPRHDYAEAMTVIIRCIRSIIDDHCALDASNQQ